MNDRTTDAERQRTPGEPPHPPTEAMWEVIRGSLPTAPSRYPRRRGPVLWVPSLAAAALAGLVLGRWTAPEPPAVEPGPPVAVSASDAPDAPVAAETPDPVPPAPDPDPPAGEADPSAAPGTSSDAPFDTSPDPVDRAPPAGATVRFAATRHLLDVGPLLTRLAGGSDPRAGTIPPEVQDWADDLLVQTRYLLTEGEELDPDLLQLLQDLELILTQVVTLPTPRAGAMAVELELIAEGMSERRILPRIHRFALEGDDQ